MYIKVCVFVSMCVSVERKCNKLEIYLCEKLLMFSLQILTLSISR